MPASCRQALLRLNAVLYPGIGSGTTQVWRHETPHNAWRHRACTIFLVKLKKKWVNVESRPYFFSPGLAAGRILSPSFSRFDTTRKGPVTTSTVSEMPDTISMLS